MKDDFGAELKGWRARKGLSQASAAAVLGVPVRTLQDWEQGHRNAGALAAEALRAKMHLSLDVQKGAAAALVQENQNKSAGYQPAAAAKHRKTYGSQHRNKKR